ncbi:MAG: hypothetical protein NUW23_13450 [Firmicutes bacterium]|jgi:hypothetical protein|nr:hypothetical protein [Bacillota bacterium]
MVMTDNAAEGPRVAWHAHNKARRELLVKRAPGEAETGKSLNRVIRQIVSRASERMVGILLASAGLKKPDVSILFEDLLDALPHWAFPGLYHSSVHVKAGDLLFSWSTQPETSIDAFWWRGPDGW